MIKLKWRDDELAPKYMTAHSAGADVKSRVNLVIKPNSVAIIPTGLWIAEYRNKPNGDVPMLDMRLRSSMAINHDLSIPNGVGTIDADYKDEIGLIVRNNSDMPFIVNKGDRIGQLVLHYIPAITNVDVLNEERKGGYGSSGRN